MDSTLLEMTSVFIARRIRRHFHRARIISHIFTCVHTIEMYCPMQMKKKSAKKLKFRFASVRLTEEEYEILENAAADECRTVSAVLRRLVKGIPFEVKSL